MHRSIKLASIAFIVIAAVLCAHDLLFPAYSKHCDQINGCPMIIEGCSGDMVTWEGCLIICRSSSGGMIVSQNVYCETPAQ
jgi:hypothetical protein